jgi:hypothetical protein
MCLWRLPQHFNLPSAIEKSMAIMQHHQNELEDWLDTGAWPSTYKLCLSFQSHTVIERNDMLEILAV